MQILKNANLEECKFEKMPIWKNANREKRTLGTLDIMRNDILGNWKLGKMKIWKSQIWKN